MPRVAYDLSSYIWHSILAGKDRENGYEVYFEDRKVWINSAAYGYDIAVGSMCKVLKHYGAVPIDMILVVEGMNSKAKRILISNLYKAKRQERAPEAYVEFEKCRAMLQQTFLELGACVMTQDFCEGDDVLAYLAENAEEDLVVATYDNDLAALNGVNSYGAEVETYIDGLIGVNKYGTFDHHLITTYKALVGDTSDNISGCPGFGPAMFDKLTAKYGFDGLQQIHDQLLTGSLGWLHENAEDCKILKKICSEEKAVITSFELAKLRPEWVNTGKQVLQIQAGMVKPLRENCDERLKQWYGRSRLVTAKNFEDALAWLPSKLAESPFISFDVETSATEQALEWLERKGKPDGVDAFGSTLTGFSLTFGDNTNWTLYFSVDHADTDNIKMSQARRVLEVVAATGLPLVIQNFAFESCICAEAKDETGECWQDLWKDNSFYGFLPNMLDTKMEANYTDENISSGLKSRSLHHLSYKQQSYDETTKLSGVRGSLPAGGKLVSGREPDAEFPEGWEERRYRMNELTAQHVFGYGTDDTIVTAALHSYYKLMMQLEHTWNIYLQAEIDAAYANASAFLSGIPFSLQRMNEIEKEDAEAVAKAMPVLNNFLISVGWGGTICPEYTPEITAAQVKEAYTTVTGKVLDTAMRTVKKMVVFIREVAEEPVFAGMLERLLNGDTLSFNKYIKTNFSGEPEFNPDSPKQLAELMYGTLKLPIRLANKVTDAARARGERIGTPKTDELAIKTALHFDSDKADLTVLEALQVIKTCGTRAKLFYGPYKNFPHWRDGLLHPNTNQCATVTRRNSASEPNYTQWPSRGEGIKFRECVVARGKNRIIISADAAGQELRLAADFSKDPSMLSCYLGEHKRDIHSIVAAAASKYFWSREWSYEEFYAALKGEDENLAKECDDLRTKSKTVNFAEQYSAQAKSISEKLMVDEEEAQKFLDAKRSQFPGVEVWKNEVIATGKSQGYSSTMLGARRHLRGVFARGDKWEISKAERQLPNFCIQGSGAEAIKIALGRVWKSGMLQRYDAHLLGSIHDEIDLDVPVEHAYAALVELTGYMTAQYAGMIVPFESSATIGTDFGKQLSLPNNFTKKDVEDALQKLGFVL